MGGGEGGGLEFSLKLTVQFVDCNHVLGGWLSSVQMDLVEHVAQYISRNRERERQFLKNQNPKNHLMRTL